MMRAGAGAALILMLASARMPIGSSASAGDFIKGVDISSLAYVEGNGARFRENGKITDPLTIFKDNGCNYIRLRLFVNPTPNARGEYENDAVNSLPYTLKLAKRAKAAGFKLLLDFHYSDTWADPGHQATPTAWTKLTHAQLVQAVHDYTRDTLKAFEAQGTLPDMVAVGNEISNGLLWPDGAMGSQNANWPAIIDLLKAGIGAVRGTAPGSEVRVMIHIADGANAPVTDWFFGHCQQAGLDYDVIGLSFYPQTGDDFKKLRYSIAQLSAHYHKDIVIAEAGYEQSDRLSPQGALPFPKSPQGQQWFLERLMQIVAAAPEGHGIGILYWEPAWIKARGYTPAFYGTRYGNESLFDDAGNATIALEAFRLNYDRK